ncbi:hypothetical protein AB833_09440 [Chromatiales bacterium (ex Bugula neritina AB1)]|nr:hypothetical protein AB833_09440 [Chromatiales bacterium (ex Bugula neritina AB1)]
MDLTNADDLEFGIIRGTTGDIDLAEWNKIIQTDNSLKQIEDRIGKNPFTKEEIVFSGEGKAYFMFSGEAVGNISLENGALLTTGVPLSKCTEIADRLNAFVEPDDRS